MHSPETVEALEHGRWLERVARRLVRDEDEAKDVVQETYLAALVAPPPEDRPLRGWLGRVATNSVRMTHRRAGRRKQREQAAPPPEPADTSFALLHKKRAAEVVTRAVAALGEPYRSAVTLRFFGDMTIAEVAAEQGVPVGTAGWRISEGLKRLRAELDRVSDGDARSWLMALCPVAGISETPAAAAATSTGGMTMTKLALLLAALLSALAVVLGVTSARGAHTADANAETRGDADKPARLASPAQDGAERRQAAAPFLDGAASPSTAEPDSFAPATPPPAGTSGIVFTIAFSDEEGEHDEALGEAISPTLGDTLDILAGCYGELLARRPALRGTAGTVEVDVDLAHDGAGGGIAIGTRYRAHVGTDTDRPFQECMRESSFALHYERAPDDIEAGTARITMEFPDASPRGQESLAAARRCFEDLQRRRPGLSLAGHIDDDELVRCADAALGAGSPPPLPGTDPDAQACYDDARARLPGAAPDELAGDPTFVECLARIDRD